MLKTLTIIRLQSVLSGMFTQEKNSRKNAGTTALLGIVMIYVVIMLLFLFSRIFLTIRDVFAEAGMTWLYFGFMGGDGLSAGIHRQRIPDADTAL